MFDKLCQSYWNDQNLTKLSNFYSLWNQKTYDFLLISGETEVFPGEMKEPCRVWVSKLGFGHKKSTMVFCYLLFTL